MNDINEQRAESMIDSSGARSERELKRRVRESLSRQNVPSLRQLDVRVDQGTLVISGRLPTFYAKQLAGKRCRDLATGYQVRMDVEVA